MFKSYNTDTKLHLWNESITWWNLIKIICNNADTSAVLFIEPQHSLYIMIHTMQKYLIIVVLVIAYNLD